MGTLTQTTALPARRRVSTSSPFAVKIRNPFNPQDFDNDKLTVVDVKARDSNGRVYQIEVQLQVTTALPARALYTWARTYVDQLGSGQGYQLLKPTLSIWVFDGMLFAASPRVHHRFWLMDPDTGIPLTDQIELHMLQLRQFTLPGALDDEAQWVYFLKEARNWTELPASLSSPVLEKAMEQLDTISDSTTDLERYRAREDYLREQATQEFLRQEAERELQETQAKLAAALAMVEQIDRERKEALAESKRQRERVRAAGLDPDD